MPTVKLILKTSTPALLALLSLSACSQETITNTAHTPWDKLVFLFADGIKTLSFGGSVGLGIILFTVLIRTLLLPIFNLQTRSNLKMQELQPQLRALKAKYPGRDMDSRLKLTEATSALYKKAGVKQSALLLPMAIQLPVMLALFQALNQVDSLRVGHFLWLDLAKPDPYFILPILAALFTFLSSWLLLKANPENPGMMALMNYLMPVIIFSTALFMASGVTLYWTVSNAYQVGQLLLFHNPFKIAKQRLDAVKTIKEKDKKKRRALNKAHKQRP